MKTYIKKNITPFPSLSCQMTGNIASHRIRPLIALVAWRKVAAFAILRWGWGTGRKEVNN